MGFLGLDNIHGHQQPKGLVEPCGHELDHIIHDTILKQALTEYQSRNRYLISLLQLGARRRNFDLDVKSYPLHIAVLSTSK